MQKTRLNVAIAASLLSLLLGSCSREDASDLEQEQQAPVSPATAAATSPAPPLVQVSADDLANAAAQIQQLADSTDKMLRRVRGLSIMERMHLRGDANATQIARAQQLGIHQPIDLDAAVAHHVLIQLPDSTAYWSLHNLNFSVPYVTPSAHAMITQIAQRFQAQLDSLHVPRFRLVITSALRTSDKQAALRRVNSNASKVESAHEFGTTVDIAYRRFAAPLNAAPINADTVRQLADSLLVKTAGLRAAELQAVLGRVIAQMRSEGKLMVMMERKQTVYHITVARPLVTPAGNRVMADR
jgi:hypothetical protein